ncbi:hypothetical protein LAZ67_10001017 [Cordylochernes scorpioides]|uniref:Reverse transcriptase Ty1/copia-type domain-containing protein n=1 Tax=Cordylochernes scorpioides TaxID=51811 RepID=A0ABY6KX50_9ARAC|nr:hypothetical protein LAZ67_10001017 [Cordylochernes scorpioides]
MTDVKILEHKVEIHIANGEKMSANKSGTLNVKINNIPIAIHGLIVDGIKQNLLSVGKITQQGHQVIFKQDEVLIITRNHEFKCNNYRNLYSLKIEIDSNPESVTAHAVKPDDTLWHRRLGHLNRYILNKLGLPISQDKCETCIKGKSTRKSFEKTWKTTKEIGELMHSDLQDQLIHQHMMEKYIFRSPASANKGIPPATIWYKRNDLSKLKVFGSRAWRLILPKPRKLDARAKSTIMVGYSGSGYRIWDPETDKEIISDQTESKRKITESQDEEETPQTSEQSNKEESVTTRSGRIIKPPKYQEDYELYSVYCLFTNGEDPVSYNQAIGQKEWKEAIDKEIRSHEELETLFSIKLGEKSNIKPIDTKWIFRTKEDGTKKARLVAHGFQMEESSDIMYAPVARMSTIRMLLSHATNKNWEVNQMDISTAFLNGNIESDIYIKAPQGVKQENGKIFKQNKAIYGLRELPKSWNNKFNEIGNNIDKVIEIFKQEFNAKDLGKVTNFLGMEISRESGKVMIKQTKFINKILEKFNMTECKKVDTPMEQTFKLNKIKKI